MTTAWSIQRGEALIGKKFGRLTVVRGAGVRTTLRCIVKCDCGSDEFEIRATCMTRATGTRSCGCLSRERLTTHGKSNSSEFHIWQSMLARCLNPNNGSFARYGGRGITICDRWRESFENFYADMGPRPLRRTLERKDNNGPYCPENCAWATMAEQCANRRSNVKVTIGGVTKNLSQWAEESDLKYATLYNRIVVRGLDPVTALAAPLQANQWVVRA